MYSGSTAGGEAALTVFISLFFLAIIFYVFFKTIVKVIRILVSFSLRKRSKVIHLNISGGIIGNLNLGKVVGGMNANMSNLMTNGHEEVAETLKELVETLAQSSSINEHEKKDLLQKLAYVSDESVREKDERNNPVLSSVIESLDEGLSKIEALHGIWVRSKLLLTSFLCL